MEAIKAILHHNNALFIGLDHGNLVAQVQKDSLFYGNQPGAKYSTSDGYIGGPNEYGVEGYYERLDFPADSSGSLQHIFIEFYVRQIGATPDSFNIVVKKVDNNGAPGATIYSMTKSLNNSMNGYTFLSTYYIYDNVPVSGPFFIGVEWQNPASSDKFTIILDAPGGGDNQNRAWEKNNNGQYQTLTSAWPNSGGPADADIWIGATVIVNSPPVAAFTGSPTSGKKPLNVQFTNQSTGVINTYSWNFGDGNTSSNANPAHTYADTGTYDVSLTVVGPGGSNTKTRTSYITVTEPPPVAAFTGSPTSGKKPLNVQFTNQSTGVINTYSWNFGDGDMSSNANPAHIYADTGTYDVSLTVVGPGGSNTMTKRHYINVDVGTDVKRIGDSCPKDYALYQNYPNPFNPTTTISFTLAENGYVSLKVFDVLGREAVTLVNAHLNAGVVHHAVLDASHLSSGMYFYRLEAGKNVMVKKFVLLK